ncbi:sensor histidine kinase [Nocardia transvalensis]|uniref:sensor histidine kinase n=1 Tax=Nocardia transvalensis TaxID=37333 RepID=UPI0018941414|nr:histidine kinase [Nocardia transvalensis]MBF6329207.1 histidine kinase [Nocardia transvalensis]
MDVFERVRVRFGELVRDPVGSLRKRITDFSYDYPPSVVVTADACAILVGIAAAGLRHNYFPTVLPIVAVVLLVLCFPAFYFLDLPPLPAIFGLSSMLAEAIFLLQPVSPDCSSLVLTVAVGMIAAIAPKPVSIFWMLAAIAEILVFYAVGNVDSGLPMYITGIVLGWMVGLMLQFQRRFLYQERENQEIRAIQAADDERRRIAREVHDVIAHSLSITLLHLTAARHALQTDRDVDEAVDALTDAERLGRQAMADIRHTVGLLDQRPASLTPEPNLDDIATLVEDFVRAGLEVEYSLTGDTGAVSATTGLALFRISQESLANIAKHAPGARVALTIAVDPAEASVSVWNTLPPGVPARRGRGMGISGMRQRAGLLGGTLTAGPTDDGWQVRARIPITTAKPALQCSTAEDSLRLVREAVNSVTRKLQEGM